MADESILYRMETAGSEAPRLRLRALSGEEAVPDARTGKRYERIGEIARGGVGVVHKARDADLGRDVAVKVLRDCHLNSPEIVQRFVEEAQIGGQLQHPGIVPVFELGLEEGRRPFFAMKLVKGETLAAVLGGRDDASDDRRRILAIFGAVCRTMAYAHSRGVVHRDLKPANIMIGAFGEVQVVDWGFAKVLAQGGVADERRSRRSRVDVTRVQTVRTEDEGSGSIAGSVFGTPAYMPPEQALGYVEELDERSDVFALGAILCEILTGEPPYAGDSTQALLKAMRCDLDAAEVRLSACEADAEMVALCRRALSPIPKERPRNAEVLSEAIAAYLAAVDERAHLSKVTAIEERERASQARRHADDARAAVKDQRRKRRWTTGLAAAVLALILVGGGVGFGLSNARNNRRQQVVSAIDHAMQEASRLRGSGELAGAVAAAERARDLAGAEVAPEDLREEVDALLASSRTEYAAASAIAARIAEDAAFVAELEEIRLRRIEGFDSKQASAEYAVTFQRHGIDLDALSAEGAAERIRRRTDPLAIAAVLDDWASLHIYVEELPEEHAASLFRVARAVDPDDWRDRLRDAVLAKDADLLMKLAEEADIPSLPVRTLDLLGTCLGMQDPAGGVAFLRRAQIQHPDDLWITYHLYQLLGKCDPPTYEEDLRFLTAVTALRPCTTTFAMLGDVLNLSGRADEAASAYRRAIALDPDYAQAHLNLGAILCDRMGRYDEAAGEFRIAIELDPEGAFAHRNLGRVLTLQGDAVGAEAEFREAIALDPEFFNAHLDLGNLLSSDSARYDEAEKEIRFAIELDPSSALAHMNLGIVLCRAGKNREAIPVLEKAIDLDPSAASSHCQLGTALFRSGDRLDEAIERFLVAIDLDKNNAFAWHNLAQAYREKREWDQAIEALRASLALKSSYYTARFGLAVCLFQTGRLRETAIEFEQALRIASNEQDKRNCRANTCRARYLLAEELLASGDHPGAITELRTALKFRPSAPQVLNTLAWVLVAGPEESLWKPKEAVELAERAVEVALDEQKPACLGTLGTACYRTGQYQRAVVLSERSIALLGGKDPMIIDRLVLAMALWRLDRKARARETLRIAVAAIDDSAQPSAEIVRFRTEADALILE